MSTVAQALENHLQETLGKSVLGLQSVVRALTVAVVARGHVLLQGPPGLGKTLLSKTLARALGGEYKRIQGTADLMPSDITGVHVFDSAKAEFVFRPGPVFADVLLVDEINRAGPKTQSALLEAMEERHVTIDRSRYALPDNFLVIATQNPREFEGTYPLPESQLDRFMLRIDMTYPSRADEQSILARYGHVEAASAQEAVAAIGADTLAAVRAAADALHMAPELPGYVLALAGASREHAHLSLGLSTRGALALVRAARVAAALRGADFVSPDDVKEMFPLVVPHRLVLASEALLEGVTEAAVSQRLLQQVAVPR
jgi:MoxR-like ATPase